MDAQTLNLESHRWQDRVIVLFSQSDQQGLLQKQQDLLYHGTKEASLKKEELEERNLKIYQLIGQEVISPEGKKTKINQLDTRKAFKLKASEFAFLLIGKDGGVKLRSYDLVSTDELFAIIDAMPMRRSEMKNKQD